MPLRPYQQETLDAIIENYNAGVRKQLVVLPCAGGKTRIAAEIPKLLPVADVAPAAIVVCTSADEINATPVQGCSNLILIIKFDNVII